MASADRNTPVTIRLLSFGIAGELVVLLIQSSSAAAATVVAIEAALLGLLLRGSRVAWSVLLLASILQVLGPFVGNEAYWTLLPGIIFILCLLAPASSRFVWGSVLPRPAKIPSVAMNLFFRASTALQWMTRKFAPLLDSERINGGTVTALAVILFIAVPVVGRFTEYREEANNIFVDVLWRMVWIPYNLLPVAIVAVVALLIRRKLKARNHDVLMRRH